MASELSGVGAGEGRDGMRDIMEVALVNGDRMEGKEDIEMTKWR